MFASSGWLTGLHEKKTKQQKAARAEFTHETQEAIYNNAMRKKVQARCPSELLLASCLLPVQNQSTVSYTHLTLPTKA